MKVCRRQVEWGDTPGAVCPDCGHTDFAHPGVINHSLDECAVCRLLKMIGKAKRKR